jgi:hypothetical protein
VFVVAATVWPIASLMLRGDVPLPSELAAVLPAVKLAGLLLLVRVTVDTPTRLLRCIRLIFWTATAVAVVAILQTMRFGPVLALLQLWWAGDSSVDGLSTRGTTTLGHSIASGDVILIGMVLMVTARVRGLVGGGESLVTGLILAAGLLAAGQFSTWLAALVAGAYMLVRIPETRPRVLRAVPVAGLALAVGAPALLGRLQDIGGDFAVPQSWLVRWDNVSNLYVPVLVEGIHPLIGVSPDSVLPSPDTWRELIYIESGYLQFLWIGGIPLLLAFVWLSVAVLRWARTLAGRSDAVGAVVSTLEVVWVTVLVVSVLDPHVFLRGAGDLLFTLIGLATGRLAAQAATTDRLLGPGRTGQLPNPVGDDPTPVRHEGGR